MKGVVIPIIFTMCIGFILFGINYETKIKQQSYIELAKAGLEQCQTSTMSQVIWVKSCTEYINARKGN